MQPVQGTQSEMQRGKEPNSPVEKPFPGHSVTCVRGGGARKNLGDGGRLDCGGEKDKRRGKPVATIPRPPLDKGIKPDDLRRRYTGFLGVSAREIVGPRGSRAPVCAPQAGKLPPRWALEWGAQARSTENATRGRDTNWREIGRVALRRLGVPTTSTILPSNWGRNPICGHRGNPPEAWRTLHDLGKISPAIQASSNFFRWNRWKASAKGWPRCHGCCCSHPTTLFERGNQKGRFLPYWPRGEQTSRDVRATGGAYCCSRGLAERADASRQPTFEGDESAAASIRSSRPAPLRASYLDGGWGKAR